MRVVVLFFFKTFLNSKITCVDTWFGSDEHLNFDFIKIEKNFDSNTSEFHSSGRLIKIKNTSNYFFLKNQKTYDLIYVDGDHSSDQVTEDINNSWKLLNKGGYLILDDFMWWYYKNLNKNPSTPINNFIIKYISEIKSLKVWHQVIIEKN